MMWALIVLALSLSGQPVGGDVLAMFERPDDCALAAALVVANYPDGSMRRGVCVLMPGQPA